jgi:cytochrome c oxidase subunit 4
LSAHRPGRSQAGAPPRQGRAAPVPERPAQALDRAGAASATHPDGDADPAPPPLRTYVLTWIALLVLLALTAGSSYVPMHAFNLAANLAIALVKALLVVFVFMHVRRGTPMTRVVAAAGVFWLALLTTLSLTDFVARGF